MSTCPSYPEEDVWQQRLGDKWRVKCKRAEAGSGGKAIARTYAQSHPVWSGVQNMWGTSCLPWWPEGQLGSGPTWGFHSRTIHTSLNTPFSEDRGAWLGFPMGGFLGAFCEGRSLERHQAHSFQTQVLSPLPWAGSGAPVNGLLRLGLKTKKPVTAVAATCGAGTGQSRMGSAAEQQQQQQRRRSKQGASWAQGLRHRLGERRGSSCLQLSGDSGCASLPTFPDCQGPTWVYSGGISAVLQTQLLLVNRPLWADPTRPHVFRGDRKHPG